MKKIYIAPQFYCVKLRTVKMLAGSITETTSDRSVVDNGEDLGVKSSSSSYNVWNEDWRN